MKKLILSLILVIGGAITAKGQSIDLLNEVRNVSHIKTVDGTGHNVYIINNTNFYNEFVAPIDIESEVVGEVWNHEFRYTGNLFVHSMFRNRSVVRVTIVEYEEPIEEPFK